MSRTFLFVVPFLAFWSKLVANEVKMLSLSDKFILGKKAYRIRELMCIEVGLVFRSKKYVVTARIFFACPKKLRMLCVFQLMQTGGVTMCLLLGAKTQGLNGKKLDPESKSHWVIWEMNSHNLKLFVHMPVFKQYNT